jgi:hypothetical protein
MPTAYEKYLQRLQSQKMDRPELDIMSRNIRSLSEPFSSMNRQLSRAMTVDNASIGSKIMANFQGQQQIQSMASDFGAQAQQAAQQRNEKLDDKIFQAEQAVEQEKKAKAAKNTQMLRAGLSAVGMIAGGLLAIPTGGLSIVAGAAIGGGIGGALGGFAGIDKGGHLSVDPEEWDMNATVEGLQQAGSVYASETTSNKIKQDAKDLVKNAGAMSQKIQQMPENVATELLQRRNIAISVNDLDMVKQIDNEVLNWQPYVNPNINKQTIRNNLYPPNANDYLYDTYGGN